MLDLFMLVSVDPAAPAIAQGYQQTARSAIWKSMRIEIAGPICYSAAAWLIVSAARARTAK
jgi:hypothetical protein